MERLGRKSTFRYLVNVKRKKKVEYRRLEKQHSYERDATKGVKKTNEVEVIQVSVIKPNHKPARPAFVTTNSDTFSTDVLQFLAEMPAVSFNYGPVTSN